MARIAARSHLAHDLFRKTGFHFSGSCFCCRSSVVEHSLGKGEVVSSILTGSTRKVFRLLADEPLGSIRQNDTQTDANQCKIRANHSPIDFVQSCTELNLSIFAPAAHINPSLGVRTNYLTCSSF